MHPHFYFKFVQTNAMSLSTITDFLLPVNVHELSEDEGFRETQIGSHIAMYDEDFPDLEEADIVLIGCSENRGGGTDNKKSDGLNQIRKAFYGLYHWHSNVKMADIGNIKNGATLQDTYAALKSVVSELTEQKKKVVILGGSHDITKAQYEVYASLGQIIEAVVVDARIDFNWDSPLSADHFLMEMLTSDPNFIRHYNHIGFQSYLVHPAMLETIDKLRFDCYRVGRVKENLEEMEPVVRNAELFSFDICAIQHSHAPSNTLTPNGFNGEEACTLMQYAGMSTKASTIGIYGYLPQFDQHDLTAKQISHMLWYLMDGVHKGKQEANIHDSDNFNQYKMAFSEIEATFLQSKKTGRWWMQLPDGKYIACSQNDYITASANEIPERWMRAMERL